MPVHLFGLLPPSGARRLAVAALRAGGGRWRAGGGRPGRR